MKTTQKILIAGIIILVILNITTLSYIFYTSNHLFWSGDEGKPWDKKNILKEKLHLTDAQSEQVLEFKKAHKSKVSVLRQKIDSLKKLEFDALKSEAFDIEKNNQIAISIGNLYAELEKQKIAHFLEIRKILTKEQLPYFIEFVDFVKERRKWRQFGDNSDKRFHNRFRDRERNRDRDMHGDFTERKSEFEGRPEDVTNKNGKTEQ